MAALDANAVSVAVSVPDLLAACTAGDVARVRDLLDQGAPASAQEESTGESALMRAAAAGSAEIVALLLERGAPWNALDRKGRCAGEFAVDARSQECVDLLVNAGVRAQLLFGIIEGASTEDRTSQEYLTTKASFKDEDTLVDDSGDAVMMEWETPLMAAHADVCVGAFPHEACGHLKERNDLRVLNVGHGLGIVDGFLRNYAARISEHCVVEPHPDVLKRIDSQDWAGVTFRRETWQASLKDETFGPFDAIFFDTYAERYEDMREFFRALPRILAPKGVFSFFNGLAPFNPFFHGVACEFVKCELNEIGLDCAFVPLQVDQSAHDDKTWDGIKRRYWRFDAYHLPIASHKTLP